MQAGTEAFDEALHSNEQSGSNPETLLLHRDGAVLIERAMASIPDRSRELLTLRELQGLSYRELSQAMKMPMGTVMSSLSRAEERCARQWITS